MATSKKETTSKKASNAAHDAVDSAAEKAEEFEELLREKAEELRQVAEEGYEKAKQRGGEFEDTVSKFIDEKPVAALGIAFVAGIAISSLFR